MGGFKGVRSSANSAGIVSSSNQGTETGFYNSIFSFKYYIFSPTCDEHWYWNNSRTDSLKFESHNCVRNDTTFCYSLTKEYRLQTGKDVIGVWDPLKGNCSYQERNKTLDDFIR